jgi:hypothetical protein
VKPLLFSLLLAVSAFADDRIKVETALPAESPVSVVVVAQCGSAVGMYATMHDGRLLAFDMSTPVPFKAQMDWATRATGGTLTVEVKCIIAPGEFTPT